MFRIEKLPLAEEDLIDIWVYGFEIGGTVQAVVILTALRTRSTRLFILRRGTI